MWEHFASYWVTIAEIVAEIQKQIWIWFFWLLSTGRSTRLILIWSLIITARAEDEFDFSLINDYRFEYEYWLIILIGILSVSLENDLYFIVSKSKAIYYLIFLYFFHPICNQLCSLFSFHSEFKACTEFIQSMTPPSVAATDAYSKISTASIKYLCPFHPFCSKGQRYF